MRILTTFFFLLICLSLFSQKENIYQSLNENWKFNFKGKWLDAEVPGNNYSDLIRHEKIPNPFVGTNEGEVQWVKNEIWEYELVFDTDIDLWNKKKKEFIFHGLDTYAEVFLNNKKILDANNQFRIWEIDVTDILKERNNKLNIRFLPPIPIENKKIKKQGYELPGGTRTMTRKAGFHYGWDWGITLTTAGIWRNVELIGHDGFQIKDVYIEQLKIEKDKAFLQAHIEYETTVINPFCEFIVNGISHTQFMNGKNGKVIVPFEINNPKLWWPVGQGTPYLYEIPIEVISQGQDLLYQSKEKVGLRTVELVTDKDKLGKQFYFKINGQALFMKGANYIPQDNLQNRVTESHYKRLLQDVVDANMNMIRVWGGGIYEEDRFYELCDSMGILVWQDFMFACAMYPGDKDYLENVRQEAVDNIKRLRNHPSIVLWCGNNENSEGWHRWGWQDAFNRKEKKKVWKAYKNNFKKLLPRLVEEHTQLPYWESSPQFGRGNPRHQFEGDAHYWGVWHDAEPFEVLAEKVPRFMSEFGFQSFPQMSTIMTFAEEKDWSLESDVMNGHQKHPRGNKLIKEYMERDYKVPSDFEDFVYVSQVLQADGMAFGLSAQRRNQPYCMGTLYWQLNDCWPVASWSSRDYYGNWKALHYAARDVFAPIAFSLDKDSLGLDIYVISDKIEDISDEMHLTIMDFSGNEIWHETKDIEVRDHSSKKVFRLDWKALQNFDPQSTFIQCELKKKNIKSIHFFEKTKNLNLPKGEITVNVTANELGLEVKLKSEYLMKDVYIYGVDGKYSDNYFSLLPNKEKTIFITTDARGEIQLQINTMNQIHEKY